MREKLGLGRGRGTERVRHVEDELGLVKGQGLREGDELGSRQGM